MGAAVGRAHRRARSEAGSPGAVVAGGPPGADRSGRCRDGYGSGPRLRLLGGRRLLRLPGLQPHPSTGMQASRAAGGVVTVVGLLGLVGKWGHQARLWVPAALTWLGSGALVAFDGLMTVLNKLFVIFGAAGSTSAWSPLDTALVVKLVVGVLAAAVGALALTAAAKDARA